MDRVRKFLKLDTSSSQEERENWTGKFDFILTCVGYSVGLGTIWRFPYMCYRNGGGAFLIPYIIYLILVGVPLVLLEMTYGQFSSMSPIEAWKISPLFRGVGVGMVIISSIVCVYFNVIIAWTLYYLVRSFTWELPWSHCNNTWNTPSCVDTIYPSNVTLFLINSSLSKARSPSEEFFENHVVGMSNDIGNLGEPQWHLVISLLLAWLIIFLALCKGVGSLGKVVYVTAILPYVLIFALLIRAVTLPGAVDGIKEYVIPEWKKLAEFGPWGDAAMQLFYSTGAAWGAMVTLASYNKFNHNCYRDAILLAVVDTFTSFLAGFVVYATLGFMASETKSSIEDVVTDGPGLVFIVYPSTIAHMPLAPLWAVLFFIFVATVGVGSQFGMFETVLSALFDHFPALQSQKMLITGVFSALELLLGLLLVCNGGIYFLQIMDWYSSTFSLMILSLTECLVISWIYGIERFYSDLSLMLGFRPCRWWGYCWRFITPLLIAGTLFVAFIKHTPVTYGEYAYPSWAIALGWILALCSIMPTPVIACVEIAKQRGSLLTRLRTLARSSDDWGPSHSSGYHDDYRKLQKQLREHGPAVNWLETTATGAEAAAVVENGTDESHISLQVVRNLEHITESASCVLLNTTVLTSPNMRA